MPKQYDHAWTKVRAVVLYRDRYECQIKGELCTHRANEADHIVALAEGGARLDPANLRAACRPCNASEGGKLAASRRKKSLPLAW